MRIVLLYPPPWKIPAADDPPLPVEEGGPNPYPNTDALSGDAMTIPYGLLTLGSYAKSLGHEVEIVNIYAFAWKDIDTYLASTEYDLYGLSIFTLNRRGAMATAARIRQLRPKAHITAGGPFASALPEALLRHAPALDSVVIGEGEATFAELLGRLTARQPVAGLAGTVARAEDGGIRSGPARERIAELDSLPPPYEDHSGFFILTSRGCPGECTFCGSPALWGRKLRFHSPEYVLALLEKLVRRDGRRFLAIKDDTFTAHRSRAIRICREIIDRQLNFLWSCDTRVDSLDEEVLRVMRRAGCQRLSLGVESADPGILKNIRKRTTPEQVIRATGLARRFGFQIRYYMMAGNRGETAETLARSIDFLRAARPDQFVYSQLCLNPGTEDFARAKEEGWADEETFFISPVESFFCVWAGRKDPKLEELVRWTSEHNFGEVYDPSPVERRATLALFPDLPAAHLDLGGACYRAGEWEAAEAAVRKALELGHPLPGFCYNYLACIEAARGNPLRAIELLGEANACGKHRVVESNLQSLKEWAEGGGAERGDPVMLTAHHDFEESMAREQPMMPGPLRVRRT